jgi:uncharacterized membrane protein
VITRRVAARPLLGIHPAIILGVLDIVGLMVAAYLSVVELSGGVPSCGIVSGCEEVAKSPYNNFLGIPVAVFGVVLSVVLLSLAIAWWKTDIYGLLLGHYALSLVGVFFDGWFLYLQVFVIQAVCIWCLTYEVSLLLRFAIALLVYVRQPRPGATDPDR